MSYRQIPPVASQERVQALNFGDTALSASPVDSNPTSELTDAECEKGHVTQRPPTPYATSKTESILKASRETIKMKSAEGEVKVAVLGHSPGAEEYLQLGRS